MDGIAEPRAAPLVGHLPALRRDRLGFIADCARRYGDAVRLRLGPRRVVLLSHPDAVREVLVTSQRAFRKGPVLQQARVVLGEGLLTSEDPLHRRQRRLVQPAFHPARIDSYAEVMAEESERLAGSWTAGAARDVHADAQRLTLAVAGRALLGVDTAAVADEVDRGLTEILSAYPLVFLPLSRWLLRLPLPPSRRLHRGVRRLDAVVGRVIDQRRRSDERGDLLSALLAARDDDGREGGMSDRQIRDEVLTLLLAGHETTATAIAFSLHLLAQDEHARDAVRREVRRHVGDAPLGREVSERLAFTRGVVAESLRLFPPSWAIGRQTAQDVTVAGVELPEGTGVLVSPWVVHRDRRWWEHPERFRPQRWTEGDGPARFAYFPFGAGSRVCVGESFAWTEAVIAIATICRRWELDPAPGRRCEVEPSITLRPRDGAWLVPRRLGP